MLSLRRSVRSLTAPLGAVCIVLAASIGLAGCAFKPLYGVTSTGSEVNTELAYIAIPEQNTRLNQLIRNDLLSSMSPAGGPLGDRYRLEYVTRGSTFDMILERNTDVSRKMYKLDVAYRLFDNETGKVIHKGRTFSNVAYDRVTQEFSNIHARTNAEERAAQQVADDMRTRIAAYFSST